MGVYFLDVMVIDDATQTFEVDLMLVRSVGRDPRLAFSVEETGLDELVLPLKDVWYAELSALNRRETRSFCLTWCKSIRTARSPITQRSPRYLGIARWSYGSFRSIPNFCRFIWWPTVRTGGDRASCSPKN